MSAGDGLGHCFVGFAAETPALDREVKKDLGAEVSLVPGLGNNHRTSGRTIETLDHRAVEPFQWSGTVAGVPNNLGNEPHGGHDHDDICDHSPLANPGDTAQIQHVIVSTNLFIG